MKQAKKLISLLAILVLLLSLLPAALAEDADTAEDPDARFRDKTWEEIFEEFMAERGVDPERVTCGYYNTVTGEEHYYNPDQYMVSASLYKVPLNMIYTERVYNGEMDWDTGVFGYEYSRALEESIINSNNDLSVRMSYSLGGGNWKEFRRILAPYMGVDPENIDDKFLENNFSTARQMIACLRLLYEEQERFPRLIDTMLRAEPNQYFKATEHDFDIAHKYGYLTEDWHLYLNDCAICFTEDPICIVLFTDSIGHAYNFMADFCTLMCDYAQYTTVLRHERERLEAEQAAIAAMNPTEAPAPENAGGAGASPSAASVPGAPAADEPASPDGESVLKTVLRIAALVILLIVALLGMGRALIASREGKLKGFPAVLAVFMTVLALAVALLAPSIGTLVTLPEGDPQETVDEFFSSLLLGSYDRAYACLNDYSSLGLEAIPSTAAGGKVYAALRQSYSYKLYGDCRIDGLTAKQQVLLEHLDLPAIQRDLKAAADAQLQRMSETMTRGELYDDDGELRPEIVDRAYSAAVDELLSRAADYTTTTGLTLSLSYGSDGWHIDVDDALLRALCGGAAYGKGGDGI